jgi:hypothetical protein
VGEEYFVALPTSKLALLAESVKKPADHATQERQEDKPERKIEWLSEFRSSFSLTAMRTLNCHAVQMPNVRSGTASETGGGLER